jgi:hypothetical protein
MPEHGFNTHQKNRGIATFELLFFDAKKAVFPSPFHVSS